MVLCETLDFCITYSLSYWDFFFTFSPFYGPAADGRYPMSFGKRFSMQLSGLNRLVEDEAMLTDTLIKSMLCGRAKQGLQKPHPSIKCY